MIRRSPALVSLFIALGCASTESGNPLSSDTAGPDATATADDGMSGPNAVAPSGPSSPSPVASTPTGTPTSAPGSPQGSGTSEPTPPPPSTGGGPAVPIDTAPMDTAAGGMEPSGGSAGAGTAAQQSGGSSGIGGSDTSVTDTSVAGQGAGGQGAGDTGGSGGAGGSSQTASCATPEFEDWPDGVTPDEIGELLVTDYLSRARGSYHYSDACAWYGALGFTRVTGDTQRNQELIDDFDPFLGGQTYYPSDGTTVDDRVGGIVPLELAIQTGEMAYLDNGLVPAAAQLAELEADLNSARYWADDMFMITALQVQAYRASGEDDYLNIATEAMLSYHQALQKDNGLMWHTRDSHIHWGRANGWVAVGMAELLQEMPDGESRDKVMEGYLKMMNGLAPLQIAEGEDGAGLWRQVLDYEDAWYETSCSAMFTYSMATGVKNGWLDAATFAPVARRGWLAVTAQLEPDGKLKNICEGTGSPSVPASDVDGQRQYYLMRQRGTGDLHGQAPVMWAASTFLRDYPCEPLR